MGISTATGEAFANSFKEKFVGGFAENNHAETMKGILAETVKINWADGFSGDKTADEVWDQFKNTWGAMVSRVCWSMQTPIIDTTQSRIVMTGALVINIDGGLPDNANLIHDGRGMCFVLTLDETQKVCAWDGFWDNEYPPMLEALGKTMAKMQEAK